MPQNLLILMVELIGLMVELIGLMVELIGVQPGHETTAQGELDPGLCFRGFALRVVQFGNERLRVTAFPPRLGDVGRHATR